MTTATTQPPAVDPDLLTERAWTDTEQANAVLVADFVQTLMNDHDLDAVRDRFGGHSYTQHNRTMTDGLDGVLEAVARTVKRFPEFSYDVRMIVADADLVTITSHVTMKAAHRGDDRKGLNITDTWRVAGGRLVEHWDSVEPIDRSMRLIALVTGGRFRNTNGVF